MNKILLLGATGRTGKHVLGWALQQGYVVTALIRNRNTIFFESEKLKIVKGSPYELNDVRKAIVDCDAVISTINNPRESDSFFAKQVGPTDVIERSIKNVLIAMEENGVERIITQSTIGASESFYEVPWWFRLMIKYTSLKYVFSDHTKAETAIKESKTIWTIVRPPRLTDSENDKPVTVGFNLPKRLIFISRKRVGHFLVNIINDQNYYNKVTYIFESK